MCSRMIASVRKQQNRYLKRSHTFGIDLSKTVDQALALDAKNGNTSWAAAISIGPENIRAALDILPYEKKAPIGHKYVQ